MEKARLTRKISQETRETGQKDEKKKHRTTHKRIKKGRDLAKKSVQHSSTLAHDAPESTPSHRKKIARERSSSMPAVTENSKTVVVPNLNLLFAEAPEVRKPNLEERLPPRPSGEMTPHTIGRRIDGTEEAKRLQKLTTGELRELDAALKKDIKETKDLLASWHRTREAIQKTKLEGTSSQALKQHWLGSEVTIGERMFETLQEISGKWLFISTLLEGRND